MPLLFMEKGVLSVLSEKKRDDIIQKKAAGSRMHEVGLRKKISVYKKKYNL